MQSGEVLRVLIVSPGSQRYVLKKKERNQHLFIVHKVLTHSGVSVPPMSSGCLTVVYEPVDQGCPNLLHRGPHFMRVKFSRADRRI